MPFAAQKAIFDRLGNLAMIEALPEKDRNDYEESLRVYRDSITVYEDAREIGFEEGREKGRKEGKIAFARKLKRMNVDTATICKASGLSTEEVYKL